VNLSSLLQSPRALTESEWQEAMNSDSDTLISIGIYAVLTPEQVKQVQARLVQMKRAD
jgi:hypothetical protein